MFVPISRAKALMVTVVVLALAFGAGIGYTAMPTKTVTETVEVTPAACSVFINMNYDAWDAVLGAGGIYSFNVWYDTYYDVYEQARDECEAS